MRPFQLIDDCDDMEHKVSLENSGKLDRIIQLLDGEEDAPGLKSRVNTHEIILMGERGDNGLVQRVNIMWKIHIWLICTLSGMLGFILKSALDKIIKP